MESNSKVIAKGVADMAKHVNSQRALRYRKPLKGKVLRRQAVIVWNEVMFHINRGRINDGKPGFGLYAT